MRKRELIIERARAGMSSEAIARRLDTSVQSVRVVCSRERARGEQIPFERDRRAELRRLAVVTLSEGQVEQIAQETGLTPQQFILAAIDRMSRRRDRRAHEP